MTGLLDLGRYPEDTDATAEAVAVDLRKAGFISSADAQIMRVKYTKLRENMVNAIHALLPPDVQAGDLLEQLRAETNACFEAAGIDCATTQEMMGRAAGMSSSVGGVGKGGWRGSSTWQGMMRGTGSSETDYLNGEVVLLGRLHGIPTPANEVMALLLDRVARQRQKPGGYSAGELRRLIRERERGYVGHK